MTPPTLPGAGEDALVTPILISGWEMLPVLELDGEGRVAAWSPGAERLMGYRAEEVLGKPATVFYAPEALRRADPAREVREAAEGGRSEAEGWWTRRDGERLWVRRILWPIRDDQGRASTGVLLSDLTARHGAEQRLRERERCYRALFDQNPDPVFLLDRSGAVTSANPAAELLLAGPLRAREGRTFASLATGEARAAAQAAVDAAVHGRAHRIALELRPRGRTVRVWALFVPVRIEGRVVAVFASCTDRAEACAEGAADEGTRYRSLVEDCREAFFFETDPSGRLAYVSPSAAALTGRAEEELLGRTFAQLGEAAPGENGGVPRTFTLQVPGNGPRTFELSWVEAQGAGGPAVRGFARDVSRQRELERELMHSALHDPLTGLANRALFWERLRQTVRMAGRAPDRLFAVLMLDVDRFKIINDTLGHLAGDEVLVGVARRLQACVRPGDTVTRFGGDEFAILLDEIADVSDAERVARRVAATLAEPFQVEGEAVMATVSVGIALGTPGVRSADDLVRGADTALYRAKALGSARHVVFDRAMQEAIEQRLRLERELAQALERGELQVDYQPVVSLRTGRIWGFEALVRWRHPVRGMVDASEFIPLAEQTGQIVDIDLWVLREACAQAARWQRTWPDVRMRVSVNLSGKGLQRQELVDEVRRALELSGEDAPALSLELPETVFAQRAESAGTLLQQLRSLDVHLQIDGYGTAGSALRHLRELPVQNLKLAPAFAARSENGSHLVRAAVSMAHSLELGVVAHGVETRAQLERMRALDCDYVQGFALSPALSARSAGALLGLDDPFGVASERLH